jgi:hypothetical protein
MRGAVIRPKRLSDWRPQWSPDVNTGQTTFPEGSIRNASESCGTPVSKSSSKRKNQPLPEEVLPGEKHVEAAVITIIVNRYERDEKARKKCIAYHGCKYHVCGFDFESVYEPVPSRYIHVHHIVPLSEIRRSYVVVVSEVVVESGVPPIILTPVGKPHFIDKYYLCGLKRFVFDRVSKPSPRRQ